MKFPTQQNKTELTPYKDQRMAPSEMGMDKQDKSTANPRTFSCKLKP